MESARPPTQLKVLRAICQGKPTKEIAVDLQVSKRTVDFHIRCIYQRLEIHNCAEAFQRATEHDRVI